MVAYTLPKNKRQSVPFLGIRFMQPGVGISQGVRIYGKRDSMPTLANYRGLPHAETELA